MTNPPGVQTRLSRARNNSDSLAPIEEMAATLDNLTTRRRGIKRTISTTLPSSPDQEDAPTSPNEESIFSTDETLASRVWSHVFQGHAFERLTQSTNYMRVVIPSVLDSSSIGIIKERVTAFMESRKENFITSRERDADKLKKRIYKIFTNALIREVRDQLAKQKQKIEEKVNDMASNKLKRDEAMNLYKEKERQARFALEAASEASQDLLDETNAALSEEVDNVRRNAIL